MKLFKKRKPWVTIASGFGTSTLGNIFGERKVTVKVTLQAQEQKDGTYKFNCFASHAVSGDYIQQLLIPIFRT